MSDLSAGPMQAEADTMPYADPHDLAAIRAFVRARALARGLPASRVDLLALAVSELTTNTLQHTSAGGWVRVWAERGQLVCDVIDTGPDRSFAQMPPAESLRGRGLAIVDLVADEVSVMPASQTRSATSPDVTSGGPDGTLVRIRMNL